MDGERPMSAMHPSLFRPFDSDPAQTSREPDLNRRLGTRTDETICAPWCLAPQRQTGHSALVRQLVTTVAVLVIFASATTACSDDGTSREHCPDSAACSVATINRASTPTTPSPSISTASTRPPRMFCESAAAVLNPMPFS